MNTIAPTPISKADFDTFVAAQAELTEQRLKDKPESLTPILTIQTVDMENKTTMVIAGLAVPFNESAEKQIALRTVGRTIYDKHLLPLAVSLSCEAWLARDPPPGVQPRDFAGRREAAILVARSFWGEHATAIFLPIQRDEQNRMVQAGAAVHPDSGTKVSAGILDDFFLGFLGKFAEEMKI